MTDARVARGLAARLRDTAYAAERLSEFAFTEDAGQPPAELRPGDEAAVALDFVLRAVHAASDRTSHAILVAAGDGVSVASLSDLVGLPRLAVLERVHELLQLGLVARDLPGDTVHATASGAGVGEILDELSADVAEWLAKRRTS